MSATEAYVAAGYSDILSEPSAYRMLNHPSVAARIAELKAAAAKAALITPARVLDETGKIAFGSITDNDNDPKWLSWLTKDQAGAEACCSRGHWQVSWHVEGEGRAFRAWRRAYCDSRAPERVADACEPRALVRYRG